MLVINLEHRPSMLMHYIPMLCDGGLKGFVTGFEVEITVQLREAPRRVVMGRLKLERDITSRRVEPSNSA